MPRFLAFPLFLLVLVHSALAQFTLSGAKVTASETRMVSEVSAIAPGEPFTLALQLTHPENWHSYYKNSGGIELPPNIRWTLPEGFTAGPIQWPVPEVKDGYTGKSFIYSGSPAFLMEITPPNALEIGSTVTIVADATWQICEKSCIDEKQGFTLKLPVSSASTPDPGQSVFFAEARRRLPAASVAWQPRAESTGGDIHLLLEAEGAVPDPGGLGLEFIPDQPFVSTIGEGGSVERTDNGWRITLKRKAVDFFDEPIPQGTSISGILTANGPIDASSGATAIRIPETPITVPPAPPPPLAEFLPILGLMLLGGLILNLMPCVFPVIGLKIMGFVHQAGAARGRIVAHGLSFTAGVLASFGVLSAILFAVREAAVRAGGGASIGWGYQLQNPWVVLGLMLLMFVLALNLFGVFEIGASATSIGSGLQSKSGLAGSFFSGLLATVVATPCSAPMLGPVIGKAVTLPAAQFFLSFGAMAVGLALPYLVLSIFPSLVNKLPRPGAWMESFKQAMSFLLFATAGYLLWVYAGLIDLENLLNPILGLSAIAVGAWIYGRWHLPHRSRGQRVAGVVLAAAFAIGGLWAAKPPPADAGIAWEPWSAERVEALLGEGIPVYIDFTASWCLTCQVNKKVAYTEEVQELVREKGIVMLRADKTKPSPAIEAKLAEFGRTAIPVNVLMVPGEEPIVTPEVLTPGYLLELFGTKVPAK